MKAVVLILDLTNDCNLRCSYCYASGGEHADCLSVSDAVLAIEKFYNRFKCQIQVLFHGGEPLLSEKNANRKILQVSDLSSLRELYSTKKIVFTNGCFDLLHIGHIHCLLSASNYGDILVVGINSDSSIKRIKGEERPVIPQNEQIICLIFLKKTISILQRFYIAPMVMVNVIAENQDRGCSIMQQRSLTSTLENLLLLEMSCAIYAFAHTNQ